MTLTSCYPLIMFLFSSSFLSCVAHITTYVKTCCSTLSCSRPLKFCRKTKLYWNTKQRRVQNHTYYPSVVTMMGINRMQKK